jgi:hypothetical protein
MAGNISGLPAIRTVFHTKIKQILMSHNAPLNFVTGYFFILGLGQETFPLSIWLLIGAFLFCAQFCDGSNAR